MKATNYLFVIVLAAFGSLNKSHAQTFENTCWTATSVAFGITVKLHFYPGNIYAYENDNGFPLDTIGYYYESNDTITFIDFQGDCNGDTGIYTFQIQNNVLDFTTVSDACADRVDQADGLVWSPCPKNNVLENTCWFAADSATTATVELEFFPGNLYTYKSNSIPYDTNGTYSISNDTIVFEDFKGNCVGDIGTYTFQIQNNSLDFTLINDNCLGRATQAGGLLWTNCAVVGLDEEGFKYSIVAYPNPTRDEIYVSGLPEGEIISYQLVTINGQIVQKGIFENASISLANLPAGMYLLAIPEINKVIKVQKY